MGPYNEGSNVTLKWQLEEELPDGSFEYVRNVDTLVRILAPMASACEEPDPPHINGQDEIFPNATGGTSFRYARKNEQFIFNWDTLDFSLSPSPCYWLVSELGERGDPNKDIPDKIAETRFVLIELK